MVKYKYKDIVYEVPTKAEDVNLGEYLNIVKHGEGIGFVSIMSELIGIDYMLLNNTEDLEFQALLMAQTQWVSNFINDCVKPVKNKTITFEGKQVTLPESFGQMKLSQRILISQANEQFEKDNNYVFHISQCIAIFLGPSLIENWDDELETIRESIMVHEALPYMQCASFFLTRQKSLTEFGTARLAFQKIRMRTKQRLSGWIGLG